MGTSRHLPTNRARWVVVFSIVTVALACKAQGQPESDLRGVTSVFGRSFPAIAPEQVASALETLEVEIISEQTDEVRARLLEEFVALGSTEEGYDYYVAAAPRIAPHLDDSGRGRLYYRLATTQGRLGHTELERQTLIDYVESGADASSYWGFVSRYELALLDYQAGNYQAAANALGDLYALGDSAMPENQRARIRGQLVDTHAQLRNWRRVIQLGEEARSYVRSDSKRILPLLYHLGTAYTQTGDYESSARTLEELVDTLNALYPTPESRQNAIEYLGAEKWARQARAIANDRAAARADQRRGIQNSIRNALATDNDSAAVGKKSSVSEPVSSSDKLPRQQFGNAGNASEGGVTTFTKVLVILAYIRNTSPRCLRLP